MKFLVIDGSPCPASIAPYVYLVLRGAHQEASSIYRGEDAKALLHAHGKHTQGEIHIMLPAISNPSGRSQHELKSDGVGNAGPVGRDLEEWQVGVDSGGDDHDSKVAINHSAERHGWKVRHPYKNGVEGHHWCFATKPKPRNLRQRAKIIKLRATLPRR